MGVKGQNPPGMTYKERRTCCSPPDKAATLENVSFVSASATSVSKRQRPASESNNRLTVRHRVVRTIFVCLDRRVKFSKGSILNLEEFLQNIYDFLRSFSTFGCQLEVPLQTLVVKGPRLTVESLIERLSFPI